MSIKKTSVRTYNITIPKFDYQIITLNLTEDEENTELGENDLIYFTVAKKPNTNNYKIQKSLNNGITYNSETQKYEIEILSEDTKDLLSNVPYGYDITIYYDGKKPKQKVIGTFEITDKYTVVEVTSNEQ